MSIGMEVWELVEEGYDVPKVTPIDSEQRKKYWEHAKDLNTLQAGVSKKILAKLLTCTSVKQLWDKLKTLYAGDSKVKKTKLQSFKIQYDSLKMRDEETISEYFERIESNVNTAKGFGAEIPNSELVEKVLRTLPIEYNPKVSTLEDR